MKDINTIRHSLAHLLAMAIKEKYPSVKLGIGPAVDNGFYYDFDMSAVAFGEGGLEKDLKDIEKAIKKLTNKDIKFEREEISASEAKEMFKDEPYKIELIEELEKAGEKISIYRSGDFVDLCAGPHIETVKEIDTDAFKLDRIAGAYWRGDEKNKMLTRVYGLAFATKEELDAYLAQIEEAKKRDHRKLGQELDLFTFSPLVGAGLPLWTPKGTIIRNELHNYVWQLRKAKGYEQVAIPHITKKDLYETSGHWAKFAEELFKIETREGKTYCLKPMNCPHHTQIYAHLKRSYKELPQRYAETTMVYRDEQSGELGGLTRVLSITQDDAHVFCRHNQVRDEFNAVWDIIDTFYKTFGFELRVRLSFHDPEQMQKYLGTPEVWQNAETEIKAIAEERGADYFLGIGEAAMYGPKLDFMAKDSLGREHQVATVQLDMNLPERFDLFCVNENGEEERIVMIHCAIMGSIERFSAVLIEHLAGIFPTWLSPIQVKVIPISEKHMAYAKEIFEKLSEIDMRVELDESNETLGKKIRTAKMQKIPYLIVVGDKEMEEKKITVEKRDGSSEQSDLDSFLRNIQKEISDRSK